MSLHHPGKVVAVLGPNGKDIKAADDSTQATVEMWDDNLLTLKVEPQISKDLKAGDIVLVDYTPTAVNQNTVAYRQVIVKILGRDTGFNLWEKYKQFQEKQKKTGQKMKGVSPQMEQEYFG
jgi:hypothetical protein